MSRKTTLAMIAACTLGLALPAVAQQPLSPPQVTPGTQIYVTDAEGLERKYRFVASDETGLHVQLNGRDLTVAWSSVCLVERRGDGVADGFLKGAALAGGLYVAVGLVSGGSLDEIAPFAAGGALAGHDRRHHRRLQHRAQHRVHPPDEHGRARRIARCAAGPWSRRRGDGSILTVDTRRPAFRLPRTKPDWVSAAALYAPRGRIGSPWW